jgi:hypothetical protein
MKRKIRAAILVLTTLAAGSAVAQENYSLWSGLRSYYLNTSVSGANVAGAVTRFPLLVRLTAADSAVFSAAKPDGADLRFSKPNGVRLHHQIEQWNAAGRTAAVWVRMDTVRGNTANQVLRMHWGKADAADSSRAAAVFDTANGFVAVWHMEGSGNVPDATANSLAAVAGGAPGSANGNIGPGRTFDGSTQYFSVADNPRLNFTEQITISLWVNAANWNGSTRLIQKSAAGDNNSGQYGLRDDSNNMMALNLNGIHTANGLAASPATGEWHLIHVTFDGSATAQYQNGALVASGSNSAPIATSNGDLQIARRPDATSYFTGTLDEVRINKVARSADWVKLEYENQKAAPTMMPTSPVSIRTEAAPRAGAVSLTFKPADKGILFRVHGVKEGGSTVIAVTDVRGHAVWGATMAPGADNILWDGTDRNARVVPAGLYAVRLKVTDADGKARVFNARVPFTR